MPRCRYINESTYAEARESVDACVNRRERIRANKILGKKFLPFGLETGRARHYVPIIIPTAVKRAGRSLEISPGDTSCNRRALKNHLRLYERLYL